VRGPRAAVHIQSRPPQRARQARSRLSGGLQRSRSRSASSQSRSRSIGRGRGRPRHRLRLVPHFGLPPRAQAPFSEWRGIWYLPWSCAANCRSLHFSCSCMDAVEASAPHWRFFATAKRPCNAQPTARAQVSSKSAVIGNCLMAEQFRARRRGKTLTAHRRAEESVVAARAVVAPSDRYTFWAISTAAAASADTRPDHPFCERLAPCSRPRTQIQSACGVRARTSNSREVDAPRADDFFMSCLDEFLLARQVARGETHSNTGAGPIRAGWHQTGSRLQRARSRAPGAPRTAHGRQSPVSNATNRFAICATARAGSSLHRRSLATFRRSSRHRRGGRSPPPPRPPPPRPARWRRPSLCRPS